MLINKDNIHKNIHRVDYKYKVGDYVMLNIHTAYKHETSYKGHSVIKLCFTNGTVHLQCSAVKIKYNICRIKPCKPDTKVDDFSSNFFLKKSTYELPVIYFCLK